jgi:glycosyltransferase involved in cell wall biosynthesis
LDPIEYVLRSETAPVGPLVSVVVSTRNHVQWLPQTLAAVMAQELDAPFELIICDDCSTDSTPDLMRRTVAGARLPVTYVRLRDRGGQGRGRNVGIRYATGRFIAFTDSDCIPVPGWLRAVLPHFDRPDVGMVQGRTEPLQPDVPFFSHFIVTRRLDGSYSTSNIVYRREALCGRRFDAAAAFLYWEDADLGWRVTADGWLTVFEPAACVHHQVIPIDPFRWVMWPTHFRYWPVKVKRHPRSRQHLFLGVWVEPLHLYFDLALLGMAVSSRRRAALLLTIPYALTFGRSRGVSGAFPPAKVAAYVARDAVGLITLLVSSIKNRRLVL